MSELGPYEPIDREHHLANIARSLRRLNALMSEEDMLQHAAVILSGGLNWVLARMYERLQEVPHDSES